MTITIAVEACYCVGCKQRSEVRLHSAPVLFDDLEKARFKGRHTGFTFMQASLDLNREPTSEEAESLKEDVFKNWEAQLLESIAKRGLKVMPCGASRQVRRRNARKWKDPR